MKQKAGVVLIDLTAAYDTVWHRGLIYKLLRIVPDRHMVKMIAELLQNRSFTLTTGCGKPSRLRRLKKRSATTICPGRATIQYAYL